MIFPLSYKPVTSLAMHYPIDGRCRVSRLGTLQPAPAVVPLYYRIKNFGRHQKNKPLFRRFVPADRFYIASSKAAFF